MGLSRVLRKKAAGRFWGAGARQGLFPGGTGLGLCPGYFFGGLSPMSPVRPAFAKFVFPHPPVPLPQRGKSALRARVGGMGGERFNRGQGQTGEAGRRHPFRHCIPQGAPEPPGQAPAGHPHPAYAFSRRRTKCTVSPMAKPSRAGQTHPSPSSANGRNPVTNAFTASPWSAL